MNRRLRLSLRPFIVLGVIFLAISLIGFYSYVRHGFRSDFIGAAIVPAVTYVLVMLAISSQRVRVSESGITITSWYVVNRFIAFADIDRSDAQVLKESNWPVYVSIHAVHPRGSWATIGLKSFRQEDAAWFCSLPQLKAVLHPGLTKKRGSAGALSRMKV